MKHGGDLLSYESYYKGQLVDFSSNINPMGIPKGLEKFLIDNFNKVESYPDIKYRKLKASISDYLGCEEENILVGNGAVEIIDSFTRLGKRILTTVPSFSEYEDRAIINGKEVVTISYKEDFTIDLNQLEKILKKDDLLILGNPNNPTGLRIEKEILIDVYDLIKGKEGLLILDEAFFEFSPEDYDSIQLFREDNYKNLGIIRAATKFFALPGLRLGYACTSRELVEKVKFIQNPWSINCFADLAGQYIFSQTDYIEESKKYIEKERNYLLQELSKIPDIKVYNTHSNYILIKLLKWNEEYVFNFFLKRGLVLRKCSSFKVLGGSHIRVAIKDRRNNIRLINGFKELTRKETS